MALDVVLLAAYSVFLSVPFLPVTEFLRSFVLFRETHLILHRAGISLKIYAPSRKQ